MMRLFITDTHTLPRANRFELQLAFDKFEKAVDDNLMLARHITDLDMAVDLRLHEITFTGSVEPIDGDTPLYLVYDAQMRIDQFARAFMRYCNLSRPIADRRTVIRAEDGSFRADASLAFTVPAPVA